jgi:stearoyl-CoA desaturase (delta-9 desaturase)
VLLTLVVTNTPRASLHPPSLIGFTIVHLAALGVFALGFSWRGVLLCAVSYYVRMFGVTAGFHRYFSHRTYRLNRFWQFAMAVLAMTAAQKGVLWWAANHRHHHKYSDMPEDIHSPVQRGFWWSHIGWILARDESPDYERVSDLAKFPELRWLDRNQYVPTMLYAVAMAFAFGPVGLFYGYFLATVLLWHGTFSINSVMHVFGKRVFETSDDSRNSMIFALLTMGEGWHNNHHHHQGSAAQGFRWWQLDFSYYTLLLLEKVRVVRAMNRVPQRLRGSARRKFDELATRWASMRATIELAGHEALAELEENRVAAMARLEALQREYERATSRRVAELRAEIEQTRLQLCAVLERLIETAQMQPAINM